MAKLLLIVNTIKYLKLKQLFFQVFYRINKVKPLKKYRLAHEPTQNYIRFSNYLKPFNYTDGKGKFKFLNQEVVFESSIDWNFMDNGKLWNYNLHYFNFILQDELSVEQRMKWLIELQNQLNEDPTGLEPYPVSLRLINSIRFVSSNNIQNLALLTNIQAEANFLYKRIEFHILGNHVLENGFALLLAGVFFSNKEWIDKAERLLQEQLKEQVLSDGMHFELSPMYHQIIFHRILELIDWYSKWEGRTDKNLQFYEKTAHLMASFLKNITFRNGDIPLFNDSANGITYNSFQLFDYATSLGICCESSVGLSSSGYQKFEGERYECVIDVGKISVDYQPGHGHADALSFILYIDGSPMIVERGTSTYQLGKRRDLERSTISHNTLIHKGMNQSEVWGGFRVGSRANVTVLNRSENELTAAHDGYKRFGGTHKRKFVFSEISISIHDEFISKNDLKDGDNVVNFHFHPKHLVEIIQDGMVVVNKTIKMKFTNSTSLDLELYKFADHFNSFQDGTLLRVGLNSSLQTNIEIL